MYPTFVAHGPFPKRHESFAPPTVDSEQEQGLTLASDVMDGSQSVEVYNLMVMVLGVPKNLWVKVNGKVGFWEGY